MKTKKRVKRKIDALHFKKFEETGMLRGEASEPDAASKQAAQCESSVKFLVRFVWNSMDFDNGASGKPNV